MNLRDNFSLFNLFLDKKVKIFVDQKSFYIRVPTIRDLCLNETINGAYHFWTAPVKEFKKIMPEEESSFDFVNNILFKLGMYKEFQAVSNSFKEALKFFIPNIEIDFNKKQLIIDDIIITEEIWKYILYLLKLSCGEKVNKPQTFVSESDKKLYMAQEEMEERIKKIKAQKADNEGILKTFLTIQYKFNLSFDYLAEQTLAQIQWLQKYAAGAVSYEVNAQAFAAGNVKKGKKLDFFIK